MASLLKKGAIWLLKIEIYLEILVTDNSRLLTSIRFVTGLNSKNLSLFLSMGVKCCAENSANLSPNLYLCHPQNLQ
jgi:hypothetical protein